jgi:hypothetical protein
VLHTTADDDDDSEQPSDHVDGDDVEGDVSDFEGLGEFASMPSANEDDSLNRRAAAERQGLLSGIPP